ncbi:hypothetical protein [Pseudorhodoferax soli]|nr:hypothetical protein [Pseudorhodoferax soli]
MTVLLLLLQLTVVLVAARLCALALRTLGQPMVVGEMVLDAGLITPTLFTMLLLMALATTALTGPLLNLLGARPPVAILPARHRVAAGPAPSPVPPTDP